MVSAAEIDNFRCKGLNQNGKGTGVCVASSHTVNDEPSANRRDLTYAGHDAERGKPDSIHDRSEL